MEIIPRARLAYVRKSEKGYTCILDDPDERTVEVEKALVSGRKPNTQRMGLDQADISLNEDGGIRVNDKLETTAKGIYAIGDVTGGWFLSHAASCILEGVFVDILVAVPRPSEMDGEKVKEMLSIGRKTVRAVEGGMITRGLCVDRFGPECDQIVVANASITVSVDR